MVRTKRRGNRDSIITGLEQRGAERERTRKGNCKSDKHWNVSKATSGKPPKGAVERVWAFPSIQIPAGIALNSQPSSAKHTTWVGIQNPLSKATVTHLEARATLNSAVGPLESGEQHKIKEINNNDVGLSLSLSTM